MSKWETAQSTPDLDKIIRLADLFGITVDELVRERDLSRKEEPQPSPQVVYLVYHSASLHGPTAALRLLDW